MSESKSKDNVDLALEAADTLRDIRKTILRHETNRTDLSSSMAAIDTELAKLAIQEAALIATMKDELSKDQGG